MKRKGRFLRLFILGIIISVAAYTVRTIKQSSTSELIYNEIESISAGAPKWYPDVFSDQLIISETNDILNIEIEKCIPESLRGSWIYSSGSYIIPDELYSLTIGILEKGQVPYFGKAIVISVANKEWSSRSVSSIDYDYAEIKHRSSYINGTKTDLFVRSATVKENKAVNYSREVGDVYIAEFKINGYEYYVEGRHGITKNEFSEFVINLIRSYAE